MNRSQSLLARIAACTIALLAADGGAADVTLSVVDAAPTARHDGTLPGIGETIFSADMHVEVTPGDAWVSGGIGMLRGSRKPEVYFYYTHDPNTGDVLLTAPGFDNDAQMFGTFMSEPRGQTAPGRFQTQGAVALGTDYWDGGPVPEAEPDWLDLTYLESPVTFTQGSGFTQRVTIDLSESGYAGRHVYAAVDGPSDPRHVLLVGFESAAYTRDESGWETRRWGFFAVPEPETVLLIALGILFLGRFAPSSKARTAMNARQVVFAKVAVAALALLAADGGAADVTLSVVDATPTARHDGTLPGIGETIFSADVHVEVTPGDAWKAGGVHGGPTDDGVLLYRTLDPNSGQPRLTAPGFEDDGQMFSSFVSLPRSQLARSRFEDAQPAILGALFGGQGAILEPEFFSVAYDEHPFTAMQGSGFIHRVTIDTSGSVYAGLPVYASATGSADPRDVEIASFISASITMDAPSVLAELNWAFYAVMPEPPTGMFLAAAALVCLLWRRAVARLARYTPLLLVLVSRAAPAQEPPIVGPQVRTDTTGHFGSNETSISALTDPAVIVAAWNDFREFPHSQVAVGVSLNGGRTWTDRIAPRPLGVAGAGDPFSFSGTQTGHVWVGGSELATLVFVARMDDLDNPIVVHRAPQAADRGLRVWAPRSGIGFSSRNQSSEAPIMRRPARHQQSEDQP